MKKGKSYSAVLGELEETLEKMNRGEIPIDKLEMTVKEAAKKISFLRRRLRATEAEITKIIGEIEDDESQGSSDENGSLTQ